MTHSTSPASGESASSAHAELVRTATDSDEALYDFLADPRGFANARGVVLPDGFVRALQMPGAQGVDSDPHLTMPGGALAALDVATKVAVSVAALSVAATNLSLLSIDADHVSISQMSAGDRGV